MPAISADAASYYTTYNLGGAERRDSAVSVLPVSNAQPLAAHELFRPQAMQQHPSHQQNAGSAAMPVSQYHPQHHPQHPQQQQQQAYHGQHVASGPMATHPVSAAAVSAAPGIGEAAGVYHSTTFAPYSHMAYNPQHAPATAAGASRGSIAAGTEHDYSMMAVAGALHAPTPPVQFSQQQQQQAYPHISAHGNGMRFECLLEAPTAAAQKVDESSLTYLNKGQLYGISILDRGHAEAIYCTTMRIAFHEDSHRKSAATYWNFWLNQQESPRTARAVELDKAGSIGVVAAENKQFDRVTFQWQGRRGAKVMIRFNCLSTDFSRIKGVKGIPLRIHLDTYCALPEPGAADVATLASSAPPITAVPTSASASTAVDTPLPAIDPKAAPLAGSAESVSSPISPVSAGGSGAFELGHSSHPAPQAPPSSGSALACGRIIERCYARIKLFRDKGAERKNKDDQRHLDKLWEKQKAKLALNGSTTTIQQQQLAEFTMSFAPVQQITTFIEYTLTGDDCDDGEPMLVDDIWSVDAGLPPSAPLESSGSAIATPVAGLSSMNLGMPGMPLAGLNQPLGGVMNYMRKRSSDASDVQSPNKRQVSPSSLSSAGLATTFGPNNSEVVGVDPTYVPSSRRCRSVLVIYARFQGENVYRAVYLEQQTADDLVEKLAQRLEMQAGAADVELVRRTKKGLTVKVDNDVVAQLEDEQDMEVECSFASDTGKLTIYLHY
ncbi:hypothetical protein GGF46_005317 [Coemansia sp. RSA 552]|nr:hypothetical protein GGF46_005317 [Coemansia sp. RSA 552]